MANTPITKAIATSIVKNRTRPVYSWFDEADGNGAVDYSVTEKLSNLNFEYGSQASGATAAEVIKIIEGTGPAYLKTIAAGFATIDEYVAGDYFAQNWVAADTISVNGLSAGSIYGGVVITTNCNCKTINFTKASQRYENEDIFVTGPRTLAINSVDAKAVYGGGAGYGSVLQSDEVREGGKVGSVLNGKIKPEEKKYGKAVELKLTGDNKITNVFGGGQKGAVVNGDVYIEVSRTDVKSKKIGTIYGGGEDAVVNGDVHITVQGINAINVGTITGSGKGKKSQVNGDKYLVIDGFSGKFTTTIKDFDRITLAGGTAITLTQGQQKTIQSAEYEFLVNDATLKQMGPMLTWNKKIDVGQIYITIDDDFAASREQAFETTIFSSTYLTQATYDDWNKGIQIRDESGELVKGYTVEFRPEVNEKTKVAKKKGGEIVLKFEGASGDVTEEDTKKREFSAADDDINIRGKYVAASVDAGEGNNKITLQKDSVMAGNVTAGSGDDRFTVQSGAIMAGTVALGAGENEIDVLGGGEINGAIKLADGTAEKHVKNTIDVNGSISQIEGGNEFTDNTIWIKNEHAVGYWEYKSQLGVRGGLDIALQGDVLSGEISLGEQRDKFIDQDLDLTHSNGSNDTVYVTQASKWDGNINFGKGKDTLILNTPAKEIRDADGKVQAVESSHGTITAEDGDDVIVANQTGVTIDADKLKLSGTDNILVVSNGVKATIKGMAIGDFTPEYGQFNGLFLGQNAILSDSGDEKGENKKYAVESFNGNMTLQGDLTVLTAKDYTNPESENYSQELADRIGTFYTVGNGVNGNINAAGNNINLSKDTTVTGNISGLNGKTITLLEGAKINGTVVGAADIYFKQNAGSEDFLFENDTVDGVAQAANIRVAKNVVATVGSINGIAGTTFQGTDDFEKDSAQVKLNEDAALYAAQDENLLVGNITKDTDFAEKYGDMAKGTISVIDEVKARVTFTDAKVYFGNNAAFRKGITFKGANTVDIVNDSLNDVVANRKKIVIDTKQLFLKDAESVTFNVKEGSELVFDGIVKGEELDSKIQINLEKNGRLAYGDTMEIKDWDKGFRAGELDSRTTLNVREEALVDSVINLDGVQNDDLTVNIADKAFVKGELTVEDKAIIRLGQGEDTLNVAAARIDGIIDAANDNNDDVINLAGSKVNGAKVRDDLGKFGNPGDLTDEVAIQLDAEDELNMTAKAKVNGDIQAGGNNSINVTEGSTVDGSIAGGKRLFVKDSVVTGSINAEQGILDNASVGSLVGGNTFVEGEGTTSKITGDVDATAVDVALYADNATAKVEGAVKGGGKVGDFGHKVTLEARNAGRIALTGGIQTKVDELNVKAVHAGSAVDFDGDVNVVANKAKLTVQDGGAFEKLDKISVSGVMVGADGKELENILKPLEGTVRAANEATLESKNGAPLAVGDVSFVANTATVSLDTEKATSNTFDAIVESGAVTMDGYGRVTNVAQATTATVEAKNLAGIKAQSITQNAVTATVALDSDAKITDGIVQTANAATVTLGGDAEIGKDIVQTATATEDIATATATVNVTGSAGVKGGLTQSALTATIAVGTDDIGGSAAFAGAIIQKGVEDVELNEATIDVKGALSAKSIGQDAKKSATVTVVGVADVEEAIFQTVTGKDKNAAIAIDGDATVGGEIVQTAEKGETSLDVVGTATVGGIVQTAGNGKDATVMFGKREVVNGDVEITEATATIAGGIVQAAVEDGRLNMAAVGVIGKADIADGISQAAATAIVGIRGEASGDVVQNGGTDGDAILEANEAKVFVDGELKGAVTQVAAQSAVEFYNEAAEVGSVGDVTQVGGTSADVLASVNVEQKYIDDKGNLKERFSEALEDIKLDKIERTIGDVSQESAANTVKLDAKIAADGMYEKGNPNDFHKPAVVEIGNVTLKAGDIDQIGDTGSQNVVTADIAYTANGESNVKVGNTNLELGSITQFSDEGKNDQDVYANTVSLTANQAVGNQSVMELGTFTGNVGAIDQTAYKASNKVDITMAKADAENLTVGEIGMTVHGDINMRAYGDAANNTLNLAGKVTVEGDVKVGGVIDAEVDGISEDSAWGDRTAAKNTVKVAAETVTLKNLTLVGIENDLTLSNDTYFDAEEKSSAKPVAKDIALAGRKNRIDVGPGVGIENISIYDLVDNDKIGVEGYELEPSTNVADYENTIVLRGEANSLAFNKQFLNSQKSGDKIYLVGGAITKDGIKTSNGNDEIHLGNVDDKGVVADQTMRAPSIEGNVKMGDPDAEGGAFGTNLIEMKAYKSAKDAETRSVSINGNVEMYADHQTNAGSSNKLSMTGFSIATDAKADQITNPQGTATIEGSVTMKAATYFDANDAAQTQYQNDNSVTVDASVNTVEMGPLSTIGEGLSMVAYTKNVLTVKASEEIQKAAKADPDTLIEDVKAYAKIGGLVDMTAKENEITVAGAPNSPTAAKGAAAYINGINMANQYTALDGNEYLIEGADNTITVGKKDGFVGSELIVGETVSKRADVYMGTVATKKDDDYGKWSWDLKEIEKAADGHDIVKYLGEQKAAIVGLTANNKIDVTGRFDAKDITMLAVRNNITVRANGELSKPEVDGLTGQALIDAKALVDEDVRTGSFNADGISQIAGYGNGAKNEILVAGSGAVAHYDKDYVAAGSTEEKAEFEHLANLPSVYFTAGDIRQVQVGDEAVDNTVKFGFEDATKKSVIAKTGTITQLGAGDNTILVDAYEANLEGAPVKTLADMKISVERSRVGAITQGGSAKDEITKEDVTILGATNTVTLTRTDVAEVAEDGTITAQTITQNAVDTNTVTMIDSTSGAITQTAGGNNLVDMDPSKSGAITQTSEHGTNQILSNGEIIENGKIPLAREGEYTYSVIDGEIFQKSEQDLTARDNNEDVVSNRVNVEGTDINGKIDQSGANKNLVSVKGLVANVEFVNDGRAEDSQDAYPTYEKAFNATVGGKITQSGSYVNEVTLENASAGVIDQTSSQANTVSLTADMVAAARNEGKFPVGVGEGDDQCDIDGHKDAGKTHQVIKRKSQADWNTQEVGEIIQRGELTAEQLAALADPEIDLYNKNLAVNTVTAENMTLDNVTQTHTDGKNVLTVNDIKRTGDNDEYYKYEGTLDMMSEYQGEVNVALEPVTKVGTYKANQTTTVGDVIQTGVENDATMKGITAGTVTQTTQAASVADLAIGDNTLTVKAVADVQKTFADGVTWDEEKFTEKVAPTHLEGSDNVRAGNKLGAITQTSGATGNYALTEAGDADAAKLVKNSAELANTTVDGAVIQTVAGQNAYVANSFKATTTAQEKDDVYTENEVLKVYSKAHEKDGKPQFYKQTTLDNINGELVQTGFDNFAALTNVNINGTVDQTVNVVSTTNGHGYPIVGEDAGDNKFFANGSKDEAYAELGIAETFNSVAVTGTITQTVNNAGDEAYVDKLYSKNLADSDLANFADVKQELTYGTNTVNVEGRVELADADANVIKRANDIYGAASVKNVTQNVYRTADKDDFFTKGEKFLGKNTVFAKYATVGNVTQDGQGIANNVVTFVGAKIDQNEFKVDEETGLAVREDDPTKVTKVNSIGFVDQTSNDNDAQIKVATAAGYITQIAESVKTIETNGTTVTTSMIGEIKNNVVVEDVDNIAAIPEDAEIGAGDSIRQIATSVKYDKIVKVDGTTDTTNTELDNVFTATNKASVASVAKAGNVTQTIQDEEGVTGVAKGSNTLTVDKSNLGNIDQNAVDGNNAIYLTNADDAVKTVGTINQDGLNNTVKTATYNWETEISSDPLAANVTTGAIEQRATGIAGKTAVEETAELTNIVNLQGKDTQADEVATLKEGAEEGSKDPESYEFKDASYYATAADSIKQVVTGVADENGRFAKDMDATNAVTLTAASAGFVWQEGDVATNNTITFTGAAVQHKEFDLDDEGAIKPLAENKAQLKNAEVEYPNSIGAVTQKGLVNAANLRQGTTAGNIDQTAVTNGTIETTEPAEDGSVVVKENWKTALSNTAEVATFAEVGTIKQSGKSETLETKETTLVVDDEGKLVPAPDTETEPNPVFGEVTVGVTNLATLTDVAMAGDSAEGAKAVFQEVTGEAGKGDNTLAVVRSNIVGAIDQDVRDGNNAIYLATADDTGSVAKAYKIDGTIDQDGISNTIRTATYDVETKTPSAVVAANVAINGAITQVATGIRAEDTVKNEVALKGELIIPDPQPITQIGEDDSDPASYTFEKRRVAAASAESIKQTAKSVETKHIDDLNVDVYSNATATNTVDLAKANVGKVEQYGKIGTTNEVTFEGTSFKEQELKLKEVVIEDEFGHDPEVTGWVPSLEEKEPAVNQNSIGEVIQKQAVKNTADIQVAASAGNITQDAVSNWKTEISPVIDDIKTAARKLDPTVEDLFKTVTDTKVTTLENEVIIDNVDLVGTIDQTVQSEAFNESITVYRKHGAESDWAVTGKPEYWNPDWKGLGKDGQPITGDVKYVNGTNIVTASKATIAGITQQGAKTNEITLNEEQTLEGAVTSGAIEQTAALAGATGDLYNKILSMGYSEIASISQTAIGDRAFEKKEDDSVVETLNTSGMNFASVVKGSVVGTVDQTAAGLKASNTLSVKEGLTTIPASKVIARPDQEAGPSEENAESFENNAFVNTVGDVVQTLDSKLKATDFTNVGDAAEVRDQIEANGLRNEIEIVNLKSTGVLSQSTLRAYGDVEKIGTLAINTITVKAPAATDVSMIQYEVPTTGDNAWTAVDSGKTVKTEVAGVDQKGFINELTLTDVAVGKWQTVEGVDTFVAGDITVLGKFFKDTNAEGKPVYGAAETSTTIKLTRTSVASITADSDVAFKSEDKTIALDSKIDLTDSEITGKTVTEGGKDVVKAITTSDGDDTITVAGGTKIVGLVDMGEFDGDNDVFTISADFTGDLSKAEIAGVEQFNVSITTPNDGDEYVTVTVKSIVADNIHFDYGLTAAENAAFHTKLAAEEVTIGQLDGTIHKIVSVADDKALAVNLTNSHTGLNVWGAKDSTLDTFTIGNDEGTEAVLTDTEIKDVETVVFKAGATSATDNLWKNTAGDEAKIAFTFKLGEGVTTFDIGSFENYGNDKIEVNELKWNGSDAWTKNGETAVAGDVYYKYEGKSFTAYIA